ncbi:MAG: FISUMP domain-containing protein, partial [Gammaproteobacteria bacterium]
PWLAIELTANWVATQPTVASAQSVDSIAIEIVMKSGLETYFFFNQLDDSGFSVFRGGHNPNNSNPRLFSTPKSKNTIKNKNVLIYAPPYNEFYKPGEMKVVTDFLANSGLGLNVTLLIEDKCTYQTVDQFANYGLVIIDTHGLHDCFKTGSGIVFTKATSTDDAIKQTISDQLSSDGYAKMLSGKLCLVNGVAVNPFLSHWEVNKNLISKDEIWVTSKYIQSLPLLSNTIVFGNMCRGGQKIQQSYFEYPPIGSSFIDRNPISYYSYYFNGGQSFAVHDNFAKLMEDSLVRSFVVDYDSTGNAHLHWNGIQFNDPELDQYNTRKNGKLFFNQDGQLDYSYAHCIDNFTDERDGQIYKAVCIGTQNWMAENLNYNVSGSLTYNNDAANGAIYGRLYDFKTLMQGAPSSTSSPSRVQGVCPKGWHVPSAAEFDTLSLFRYTGGYNDGGALKSTSALWNSPNTGATNSSGFSALPAGWTSDITNANAFLNLGYATTFATTTVDAGIWQTYGLSADSQTLDIFEEDPTTAAVSCRCVKDP